MARNSVGLGIVVAFFVAAQIGCGTKSSSPSSTETLGTSSQALSVVTIRTFGFESLQDWSPISSSPTLSLSTTHSQGQSSLGLAGGGWMQVKSRALGKEDPAPSVVGYDIQVPSGPLNPWWYGTTELSVDAPSVGIYAQLLGQAELTGFPTGFFKRVEFTLPQSIKTKLGGNYTDLTFRIAVNVTTGEPKKYLLDRFTFGPASPTCTSQSDGNPCTDDICLNGVPAWPAKAAGTACDTNATVCDGAGACNATGTCVLGAAPPVDDGNPCTTDSCDPASGVTHVAKVAGTSCANATVCDGAETCNAAGSCTPGPPPSVDDGNACTIDSCDAAAGVIHTPRPSGTSCADASVCNGSEVCSAAGACLPGTPVTVPPDTACVTYACEPVAGVVATNKPQGSACDDATVCNGSETCQNGSCVASAPPTLDDGNPCTVDACEPSSGVSHTAVADGTTCDADNDVCNGIAACASGACSAGTPPVLDDGNTCTVDSCDAVVGVVHAAASDGTSCNDSDACTSNDACHASLCVAGSSTLCVAADDCHEDGVCDAATGACSTPAKGDGTSCDDGDACTCQRAPRSAEI